MRVVWPVSEASANALGTLAWLTVMIRVGNLAVTGTVVATTLAGVAHLAVAAVATVVAVEAPTPSGFPRTSHPAMTRDRTDGPPRNVHRGRVGRAHRRPPHAERWV